MGAKNVDVAGGITQLFLSGGMVSTPIAVYTDVDTVFIRNRYKAATRAEKLRVSSAQCTGTITDETRRALRRKQLCRDVRCRENGGAGIAVWSYSQQVAHISSNGHQGFGD